MSLATHFKTFFSRRDTPNALSPSFTKPGTCTVCKKNRNTSKKKDFFQPKPKTKSYLCATDSIFVCAYWVFCRFSNGMELYWKNVHVFRCRLEVTTVIRNIGFGKLKKWRKLDGAVRESGMFFCCCCCDIFYELLQCKWVWEVHNITLLSTNEKFGCVWVLLALDCLIELCHCTLSKLVIVLSKTHLNK